MSELATPLPDFMAEKPLFMCVMSNTDTAKIPNISAAGKTPELTDYTPAGDCELIELGHIKSVPVLPFSPSGSPTPALITRSALRLSQTPAIYVNSGLRKLPSIPVVDLHATPGADIRSGQAVADVEDIFKNGQLLGEHIGKLSDFIVIGESTPGGTTTALAILRCLGMDGNTSSSISTNPMGLKMRIVNEAMEKSSIGFGDLTDDPLRAVELFGDPMMPAVAGLAEGLCNNDAKVVLAGGTQMVAVLAIIRALGIEGDISIATTKFVANDTSAHFHEMVDSLGYHAYVTDPGFYNSDIDGLLGYERGEVKEGVGAGGALLLAAMAGVGQDEILTDVESFYRQLVEEST